MLYGIFVTICFSNESKIDVAVNIHLCSWYRVPQGSPLFPVPVACFVLLFILTISIRICEMWLSPVFTGDKLFIGDKFESNKAPLLSFLLYHSTSAVKDSKPLSFILIDTLKPPYFLEWEYPSEKWHVRRKQNCSTRYSAPSPQSSLYFRNIVVGQKYI